MKKMGLKVQVIKIIHQWYTLKNTGKKKSDTNRSMALYMLSGLEIDKHYINLAFPPEKSQRQLVSARRMTLENENLH